MGIFFSFFLNRVDKTRISSVLKKSQTSNDDDSFFQETDNSVRLKIASLLGLLSKTQGFSPDCIVDDAINTLSNESTTHLNIYPSPTLRETFIVNCFVSLCVQSPIKFSPSCWTLCWSLVHSCPRVLHWDWGSWRWPTRWHKHLFRVHTQNLSWQTQQDFLHKPVNVLLVSLLSS